MFPEQCYDWFWHHSMQEHLHEVQNKLALNLTDEKPAKKCYDWFWHQSMQEYLHEVQKKLALKPMDKELAKKEINLQQEYFGCWIMKKASYSNKVNILDQTRR